MRNERQIYNRLLVCPNHCHLTDKRTLRCPRCGRILIDAGHATEENKERVMEQLSQEQVANYN